MPTRRPKTCIMQSELKVPIISVCLIIVQQHEELVKKV